MIPTVTKTITLTKDEVKNMLIKYLHRYHHVSGIFDVQFLINYKSKNDGSNIHDTSSFCEFDGVKIEVSENENI